MTYACSKYRIAPMIPVTAVKSSVGEIIGNVMCHKRCHAVAPSIAADSYNSCGTS